MLGIPRPMPPALDRLMLAVAWLSTNRSLTPIVLGIAIWLWVNNLVGFYGAGELVGFSEFKEVQRVLAAFLARDAVKRGLNIPARPTA